MAIFDSTKRHYLNFFIHLTDAERVAELQAEHPTGYNSAIYDPRTGGGAATEFEAPFLGYKQPAMGQAPFTWTPNSGEGEEDGPYPINVRTFERRTGGFLGLLGGTTIRYYWMGKFVLASEADNPDGVADGAMANIARRRFIEGFEFPGTVLGSFVSGSGLSLVRDASRHLGGMGLAFRGPTSVAYTVPLTTNGAVTDGAKSWERFYIRLRQLPASTVTFYRAESGPTGGSGIALGITATGQLAFFTVASSAAAPALQSVMSDPLPIWNERILGTESDDGGVPGSGEQSNAWVKIDVVLDVATSKLATVYVANVPVATLSFPVGQTSHVQSTFGQINAIGANDLYLDIDDWINAEIPETGAGDDALTGLDFINGTKIVPVRPTSYAAAGSWTGDFRILMQPAVPGATPPSAAATVSTTSGDLMRVNTDGAISIEQDRGAIGCASVQVSAVINRGATLAPMEIGYEIAGGAAVDRSVSAASTPSGATALFSNVTSAAAGTNPSAPPTVVPLVLRAKHQANGETGGVRLLCAQAELFGKWGPEDYREQDIADTTLTVETAAIAETGQHNTPYPRSPWSTIGIAPPVSPYIIVGGTYVGNGTGQDLTFRAPVNWFFVRPTTGVSAGHWWCSAMWGSARQFAAELTGWLANADEDQSFTPGGGDEDQMQQYRIRIAGNDAHSNAAATTYQYIAVCDPGMRFSLNVSAAEKATLASRVRRLVAAGFTPGFSFIHKGAFASNINIRTYGKSEGLDAQEIARFDSSSLAAAFEHGTGQVTILSALNNLIAGGQITLSMWRRSDGNDDTGEARAVCFGSYVGDGSASRTVNLAPAANRRPMFAIVFPDGGVGPGAFRDPSHTTNTSTTSAGASTATGITGGGIDQFSVGSSLNGNGVTYSYFVLYGPDGCTGNGGWGCNGEVVPVEPDTPGPGGAWPEMPPEPGDPTDPGEPGPGDPGFPGGPPTSPPDFEGECLEWSTYMVNVALSRIGVSKQIADIAVDTSEEAYKARLIYAMDVEETLRDFPWPFATRYADLVLIDGSEEEPVNKDWTYSYRAPADMIMARRIVGQDRQQRTYDKDPIKFRIGTDATGYLLYCNEAADADNDRPVQLEYTIRMNCPAQQGDPLYRSALVWKLSASLARVIARDSKKADACELMYRQVLLEAKEVASDEQQHDIKGGDPDWITGR